MKKALFFFLVVFSLQSVHAQNDKLVAYYANVVCQPLEFVYLGEFKVPNNQVEIRWKVIGRIQNIGNATYHSTQPGNSSGFNLFVTNDIANKDQFHVKTYFNTIQPGEIKKLEMVVKYIKRTTRPEIDSIFFDGTAIQCIERKFVPIWDPN